MEDVVIVSAVRTPVGKFQGSLSDFSAPQLGAIVVREAVKRAGIDPNTVDECIMGNVVQPGWDRIPRGRQRWAADFPDSVSATTINKVCGSGLKAVALGAAGDPDRQLRHRGRRRHGEHDQRSLPSAPGAQRIPPGRPEGRGLHGARWPVGRLQRLSHGQHRRERRRRNITSRARSRTSTRSTRIAKQSPPSTSAASKTRSSPSSCRRRRRARRPACSPKTNRPREDTTIEALRTLKPAFKKDGTVTAGNAPGRERRSIGRGA